MKKRLLITILSAISILSTTIIKAQVQYPIRSHTVITAPAPMALQQFASIPGKLTARIWVEDIAASEYPVRIRLHLKSSNVHIYTSPSFVGQPIYLNGGETTVLEGADLEEYLLPQNMIFEGLNKLEYQRTNRLPEGAYRVWLEVFDYYHNIKVSSEVPGIAMLYATLPPKLMTPKNESEYDPHGQQLVRFSWVQQAITNPLSDIRYTFALHEIKPKGRNVYEAIKTTPPLYTTETSTPYLLYDASMPVLEYGNWYAWQVTVKDENGEATFKNGGVSEAWSFRFGISCQQNKVVIKETTSTSFKASWKSDPNAKKYLVSMKKRDADEWQVQETCELSAEYKNLAENTYYQVKVQNVCYEEDAPVSDISEHQTGMKEVEYSCGQRGKVPSFENQEPLKNLVPGDYFKAYDFWIKVTEAKGGNGTFTGKGIVTVPFIGDIGFACEYTDITLNTDGQMIDGVVNFSRDSTNNLLGTIGGGNGDAPDNPIEALMEAADNVIEVEGGINDVSVSGNNIIITKEDGSQETQPIGEGEMAIVVSDKEGEDAYLVDAASGTVYTGSPSPATGVGSGNSADKTVNRGRSDESNIVFSANPKQKNGFDAPADGKPGEYFEYGMSGQPLAWKSLEQGRFDKLLTTITGKTDSIRYQSQNGLIGLYSPKGENEHEVCVQGYGAMEEDVLEAYIPKAVNDSAVEMQVAGQVSLVSYSKKILEVKFVSVNGAPTPNPNATQGLLNNIYKGAVVEWKIKPDIFHLDVEELEGHIFEDTGSGLTSPYTSHMKLVRRKLKNEHDIEKDVLYLFFVKHNQTAGMKGYMPLGYQYGFIYVDQIQLVHIHETIAHELGHGAFRLRHTFSDHATYKQTQGTTANLMDYSKGSELWKYQWDLIHDPENMLFKWGQDEEEGMEADEFKDLPFIFDIKSGEGIVSESNKTYMAPSGMPFLIKGKHVAYFKTRYKNILKGALIAFEKGKYLYRATYFPEKNDRTTPSFFSGYRRFNKDEIDIEEIVESCDISIFTFPTEEEKDKIIDEATKKIIAKRFPTAVCKDEQHFPVRVMVFFNEKLYPQICTNKLKNTKNEEIEYRPERSGYLADFKYRILGTHLTLNDVLSNSMYVKGPCTYLTPANKPIVVTGEHKAIFKANNNADKYVPNGALYGFYSKSDMKLYLPCLYDINELAGIGYDDLEEFGGYYDHFKYLNSFSCSEESVESLNNGGFRFTENLYGRLQSPSYMKFYSGTSLKPENDGRFVKNVIISNSNNINDRRKYDICLDILNDDYKKDSPSNYKGDGTLEQINLKELKPKKYVLPKKNETQKLVKIDYSKNPELAEQIADYKFITSFVDNLTVAISLEASAGAGIGGGIEGGVLIHKGKLAWFGSTQKSIGSKIAAGIAIKITYFWEDIHKFAGESYSIDYSYQFKFIEAGASLIFLDKACTKFAGVSIEAGVGPSLTLTSVSGTKAVTSILNKNLIWPKKCISIRVDKKIKEGMEKTHTLANSKIGIEKGNKKYWLIQVAATKNEADMEVLKSKYSNKLHEEKIDGWYKYYIDRPFENKEDARKYLEGLVSSFEFEKDDIPFITYDKYNLSK